MQAFAKKYGFHHTRTSSHYHQSKGKVEAATWQPKKIVWLTQTTDSDFYLALLGILNTPQEGMGSSPAQTLMNRRTRTTLPSSIVCLKPRVIPKHAGKPPEVTDTPTKILQQGNKRPKTSVQGRERKNETISTWSKEMDQREIIKKFGIRSY